MKPKEDLGFFDLYYYATKKEKIILTIGTFFSFVAGAALPISTIFLGDLVNLFSVWEQGTIATDVFVSSVNQKVLIYVYLARKFY
jgi:ATP-binding cassette subfamily B (MDR/TAP) protein 1